VQEIINDKTAEDFFVLLAVAFGIVLVGTDPKLKQRGDDERRAEQQAAQEKADRNQKEWRDGWAKWMEEGKRNKAERAKQANEAGFDDGFTWGFLGGKLTRTKTNIAISSTQINALAMRTLEEKQIPPNDHAGFVRGFSAGWTFGWINKK